jgi:hypothetical protein
MSTETKSETWPQFVFSLVKKIIEEPDILKLENKQFNKGELLSGAMFCIEPEKQEWPQRFFEEMKIQIKNLNKIDQLKMAQAFINSEIDRLNKIEKTICNEHRTE